MDPQSDSRPPRLTAKQRRFIDEYCVARRRARAQTGAMFNGTAAAIEAGYSKKTAKEMAHENLTKPHIRREIETRLAELSKRAQMQADEVLDLISELARVPVLDESGHFRDVAEARMVLISLELLGKYHKLWTEKREIGGMDGPPIQFALPRMEDSEPVNLPEEGAP